MPEEKKPEGEPTSFVVGPHNVESVFAFVRKMSERERTRPGQCVRQCHTCRGLMATQPAGMQLTTEGPRYFCATCAPSLSTG